MYLFERESGGGADGEGEAENLKQEML